MADKAFYDDIVFLESLPAEEVDELRERFGTLVSEDPRRAADIARRGLHLNDRSKSRG